MNNLSFRIVLICILFVFIDCKKGEGTILVPTGRSKSYMVTSTDLSNIEGTVEFIENDNTSTTIRFDLTNSSASLDNPIYLRRKTAFQGGDLVAILGNLNGSTGKSSFTISQLASGQKITYDELLVFDGYIAIELDDDNSGKLAAAVDIGPNERTGNKVTYSLLSTEDFSYSGQATFAERINGSTSLLVSLIASNANATYPSHIHNSDQDSENEILLNLSSVEGSFNGHGFSEISELNGTPLMYNDILELNASIDIHDYGDPTKVIASGGIGSNADAIQQN